MGIKGYRGVLLFGNTCRGRGNRFLNALRRGTLYPDELRGHYRKKGGMIAVEGLWLKVR